MAKVQLPLLGVSASGTIGDSITFGNWKGINYARQRVIPANPRTQAQVAQRETMTYVVSLYKRVPAVVAQAFELSARNTGMSGYNLFVKRNLVSLRGQQTNRGVVFSPGQSGGVALEDVSAQYANGSITATATPAAAIPGVTISRVWFLALPEEAPVGETQVSVLSASDDTSPYGATFSVAAGSGWWVVSAFTQATTQGGATVFGVSLNTRVNVAS